MNAVFTIVAQNFLGQAYTLAESVRRFNPELDFFIFIADRLDASVVAREKVTLVEARTLSIPDVTSMSFKYDVTEFCTAIKPFCFSHLFQHRGYEKVLYFDPDICV
ncbi:MAG TPA: hypothetical protein VMM37_04015, partial [Bacteroidota bacterium]|nr:hypothetical protein [Bacteroidota bacterium]